MKARSAGFTIRLIDGNSIGITPLEQLTQTQRQWLSEHRDDVVAELLSEAANEVVKTPVSIHWQAFMDECILLGAASDEVTSLLSQQDIADLCEEPADKLPLHARTIVDAIKRQRPADEPETCNVKTFKPTPRKALYNIPVLQPNRSPTLG
ncbi:MAG: hypothetical protein ACJAVI_005307 [Candidatus Azotimanducaceae bacterium]|jgi:hypothetical protein